MEPQRVAGSGYHGERPPSGRMACVQGTLFQVVREGWGVDRQDTALFTGAVTVYENTSQPTLAPPQWTPPF